MLWLVYWVKIGEITSDLFYEKGDVINPPTQHISLKFRTDTYNYKLSDTYYQIIKLGNTRRNQTASSTVVLCLGQK